MYEKVCKWCDVLITVEKQQSFASHVAGCSMNPKVEERYKRNSERFKGVLKVERIEIVKECPKCKETFKVIATESEIRRNKVRVFCSRKCSNGRIHSEQTKEKMSLASTGIVPYNKGIKKIKKFTCIKCGKEGIIKKYNNKQKYHSECWRLSSGGIRHGSSRGKSGWYKGYWCDSSYELAYLIYNLDNSILIERNKNGFEYTHNDEKHLFYPDFIIDGKYIEIKNYKSELTDSKISQFPYDIEIYYKEEMKPFIEYVKNKYGKDFIRLYE